MSGIKPITFYFKVKSKDELESKSKSKRRIFLPKLVPIVLNGQTNNIVYQNTLIKENPTSM